MSRTPLKEFQERAVQSGLALFGECKRLLGVAGEDAANRTAAVSQHGTLLLEAPTGAGKTLIAGRLLEAFSAQEDVLWFWFAPFKGVTGQTAATLRSELPGLRLRDLATDRKPDDNKTGDVFVTTWQTVATRVKDSRNVHKPGEQNLTLEQLVGAMRRRKLRLGVVIDEAHHGFFGSGVETQSMKFFRETLQPDYTVLVTATPDDADLKRFEEKLQLTHVNRCTISRHEPVDDGLIKEGIKCVAYFAEPGQERLVDFEDVALREGAALHNRVKSDIGKLGIDLAPLMLVQVDSTDKSVERAKDKLLKIGFLEKQIAIHTAEEPDSNLLALANDETREVLIFKMAVALGFDAPRASTLVSMRAAKDEDFGVQLVGRILRVHRRLQARARAKSLPDSLRYGFVFLADAETQTGLDLAGQRINKLQTEYAKVSPTTAITNIGGKIYVQALGADGQLQIVPLAPPPLPSPGDYTAHPIGTPPTVSPIAENLTLELLAGTYGPIRTTPELGGMQSPSPWIPPANILVPRRYSYRLKANMPRRFKTQVVSPDSTITEEECARHFMISSAELLHALVAKVQVARKTLEVFTHQIEMDFTNAAMDPDEAARTAVRILNKDHNFDSRELRRTLLAKLSATLCDMNLSEGVDEARVIHLLNVILCSHPQLLYEAQKAALAEHCEVVETEDELPGSLESEAPLKTSRLNVYGVVPSGLNTWEEDFADVLDRDQLNIVSWWHRNEPQKAWSVQVVLADGRLFFPDFVIGVEKRVQWDRTLLADPKYGFEVSAEIPKSNAKHPAYGRVLILTRKAPAQWLVVRYDEAQKRAVSDHDFWLPEIAAF